MRGALRLSRHRGLRRCIRANLGLKTGKGTLSAGAEGVEGELSIEYGGREWRGLPLWASVDCCVWQLWVLHQMPCMARYQL